MVSAEEINAAATENKELVKKLRELQHQVVLAEKPNQQAEALPTFVLTIESDKKENLDLDVEAERQRILCAGMDLENNKTLSDYGIEQPLKINLLIRNPKKKDQEETAHQQDNEQTIFDQMEIQHTELTQQITELEQQLKPKSFFSKLFGKT